MTNSELRDFVLNAGTDNTSADQRISAHILLNIASGMTVIESIDAVLGAGTYANIVGDVFGTLRAENRALRERNEELERADFMREQRKAYQAVKDMGDCPSADDTHIPGCGADDTRDSKGYPLRPLVNDAGEPCWM